MPIGYSETGEKTWWQAVYRNLKEAEVAAVNAMAHNLEDQTTTFEVQDTIETALNQTRLICQKKGIPLPPPTAGVPA